MQNSTMGVLVLAGGKGSRMGYVNKALLTVEGETFLERIAGQVRDIPEKLLSVGCYKMEKPEGFQLVQDVIEEIGPMGGLYSGVLAAQSEMLLVLSCDIPFFQHEMIADLSDKMQADVDACVFVEKDGHVHPLCGIYRKRCLSVLESCIREKDYRMMSLLKQLRTRYIEVTDIHMLENINTKKDWEKIQ